VSTGRSQPVRNNIAERYWTPERRVTPRVVRIIQFSPHIQPFFSSLGALPPVGLPAIDCFLSFLPPRSSSKWPALPARVFSVTACRPAVCFLWMVLARTRTAFLGLITLLPVWMRCELHTMIVSTAGSLSVVEDFVRFGRDLLLGLGFLELGLRHFGGVLCPRFLGGVCLDG
jgi:hypothetical protein